MTTYPDDPIQHALFQAAKVGNISLIRELIQKAGADPFAVDEKNRDAIFYAWLVDPAGADALRKELSDKLPKLNLNRQDISKESLVNQEDEAEDKYTIQSGKPETDESEIQMGKSESRPADRAGEAKSQPAERKAEPVKDNLPASPVLTDKPGGILKHLFRLFKMVNKAGSRAKSNRDVLKK